MNWLHSAAHARWLEQESDELLTFGAGAMVDDGFGFLDRSGQVELDRERPLWLTCRMIHSYSLGVLLGRPGAATMVDHGLTALAHHSHDAEYGGWYAAVGPQTSEAKEAYAHAFVILAGASATAAGRPGAEKLLQQALEVSERHFWREAEGMVVESWDREFTTLEDYRGVNANMHTVEAYLTAADVTGEPVWLQRAARITAKVVGFAREHRWRIPEHFDAGWHPLLDYNADQPAHPFRPAGATVGHWLEWSRLVLQVRAALRQRGMGTPEWMVPAARDLFHTAVREGWAVDGAEGFLYTVAFDGTPLVRARMHWVLTEALAAAAALYRVEQDPEVAGWYQTWWEYAANHLIDEERGSWLHELDESNQPAATVWGGKPDIYHALQATLMPRLPLTPMFAPALAAGLLDT
ncbi:MAG TPA: AGE family epimerase/isomerase [Beutenbergiaceae bacterium]|nr:AGE family epimerase/isomerase [Beutenbergiaceae bacterium]